MRTFRLPDDAPMEGIEAHFDGGALKAKIPKTEKAEPRATRIEVR